MIFDALLRTGLDLGIFLRWPRIPWRYWKARHSWPRVAFPQTYAERIQWRKIFDRNPLFVVLADKLAAKDYIADRCPSLALPRTIWSGTCIEDAPRQLLSNDVVVKANHSSGQNLFIKGGRYDPSQLSRLTAAWLSQPYGQRDAEWAYYPIGRRLFIEEMLGSADTPLMEINIRAGGGRAGFANLLLHAKTPQQSVVYLDEIGQTTHVRPGHGVTEAELLRLSVPDAYITARMYAAQLSEGLDFARVDFFCAGGQLYAGEITLYPQSGYAEPNPYERQALSLWDIRESWFMKTNHQGWRALYRDALERHLDRTGQ